MKKILILGLIFAFITSPSIATTEWRNGDAGETPTGTDLINNLDTVIDDDIVDPVERLLSNYRRSATLYYSSGTTLIVDSGEVVCSNSAGTIRKFRANPSTTSVTFTDLDTGSETASTTYYVYAVCDADATTFTIKISTSSTSPSGITSYKKIGSFYNNSSSDIDRTKFYSEPYGNTTNDANGAQSVEAVYDYADNGSSFTSKSGGLFIAFGNFTVGGSGTQAITNLPYNSGTSYSCFIVNHGTLSPLPHSCRRDSGSQMTLLNGDGASHNMQWMTIGY